MKIVINFNCYIVKEWFIFYMFPYFLLPSQFIQYEQNIHTGISTHMFMYNCTCPYLHPLWLKIRIYKYSLYQLITNGFSFFVHWGPNCYYHLGVLALFLVSKAIYRKKRKIKYSGIGVYEESECWECFRNLILPST